VLIKDVMTRDLLVVAPDATLEQASAVMRDGAVGALPVVFEEQRLLGIVTDRDLVVRALAEGLAAETPVEQVMTREVTTVRQAHELDDALALMQAEQLRRLPVVDDGRLVGIIAQADLAALSTPTQFADAVRKISEPAATRTEHRAE